MKLRGLPYSATKRDIIDFFVGFDVSESDIVFECNKGKPTGFALVFLSNKDDVQRARRELDRKHVGNRYVDVMAVFRKT